MSPAGLVRGVLKLAALVGGLLITVVCLMALVGTQSDSGWLRVSAAVAIALVVPAVLVETVLSRVAPDRQRGITSDVLALTYMGFALAFVGGAHAATRPWLAAEGHRLETAGRTWTAKLAYTLAGGRTAEPELTPFVLPSLPAVPTPPKHEEVAQTKPATPAVSTPPAKVESKDMNPAQIFSTYAPAVVTITIKQHDVPLGGGTGFIIDASGTIATNNHVIDSGGEIEIKLMDGTVLEDVEILDANEALDLAILHAKAKTTLPVVVLGDSDKVTVGEQAIAIGNPLGLDYTLTDGLVSARRMLEGRKLIQMSVPVSPGNSGGPVFNMRGEVIGISTAQYGGGFSQAQNLNLAVPINDLKGIIKPSYPAKHKPGQSAAQRW